MSKRPTLAPPKSITRAPTSVSDILQSAVPTLTSSQIDTLVNLQYPGGSKILTVANTGDLYQIIGFLHQMDAPTIIEYLKTLSSPQDLLWNSPTLREAQDHMEIMIEAFRNKREVAKGVNKCRRCGSEETISVERQRRSADEPTEVSVTCVICSAKWKM